MECVDFGIPLTEEEIRKVVLEIVPYPAQHPITDDLEIAEKLQIRFEQGRLLTISKDGTSAKGSHMGRSGYIIANRLKMWCHTVLLLDELVVDLWRIPTVMSWKDFWEKIGAENLGTELKIFDEDSQEEVTEELTGELRGL